MNFDPLLFAEAEREIDFTRKMSEKTVLSAIWLQKSSGNSLAYQEINDSPEKMR